jgi:RNA-directed DNA polymerase
MTGAYERLCSFENLLVASVRAARGKRQRGSVAVFDYRLADALLELQRDLRSGTYRPGRYVHFFIHEPKRRKISAAPFKDRVVHHAVCAVIEPRFECRFIPHSYANRVGKELIRNNLITELLQDADEWCSSSRRETRRA